MMKISNQQKQLVLSAESGCLTVAKLSTLRWSGSSLASRIMSAESIHHARMLPRFQTEPLPTLPCLELLVLLVSQIQVHDPAAAFLDGQLDPIVDIPVRLGPSQDLEYSLCVPQDQPAADDISVLRERHMEPHWHLNEAHLDGTKKRHG